MSNNILYYSNTETFDNFNEVEEVFYQSHDGNLIAIALNIPSASTVVAKFRHYQNQLSQEIANFGKDCFPSSLLPHSFFIGLKFHPESPSGDKFWEVWAWGNIYFFYYEYKSQNIQKFYPTEISNLIYYKGYCKPGYFWVANNKLGEWFDNQINRGEKQWKYFFTLQAKDDLPRLIKNYCTHLAATDHTVTAIWKTHQQRPPKLPITKLLIIGFSFLTFACGSFSVYLAFQKSYPPPPPNPPENIFQLN